MRDQFALDPELAHFAAYVLASHPGAVGANVIDRGRRGLRGGRRAADEGDEREERGSLTAAARYLGGRPARWR